MPYIKFIYKWKPKKAIEAAISKGEYVKVSKAEFSRIAEALAARKKDAILHIVS
ncbi:MAG: hypothetical protein KJ706_08495 [Candidatus Omnitrophica bacterium]|nr:hypothetical protein [Candidatus Omnitrophota bacterium]